MFVVYWNILSFKQCNISSSLRDLSNTTECPSFFFLCLPSLGMLLLGQTKMHSVVSYSLNELMLLLGEENVILFKWVIPRVPFKHVHFSAIVKLEFLIVECKAK